MPPAPSTYVSLLTRLSERDTELTALRAKVALYEKETAAMRTEAMAAREAEKRLETLRDEHEALVARFERQARAKMANATTTPNSPNAPSPRLTPKPSRRPAARRRVKRTDVLAVCVLAAAETNLLRHAMLSWVRVVLHAQRGRDRARVQEISAAQDAAMDRGARIGRARAGIAVSRWLAGRAGRVLRRSREGVGAAALSRWRFAAASAKWRRRHGITARRRKAGGHRPAATQTTVEDGLPPPPSSPEMAQRPKEGRGSWLAPASPLAEASSNSPRARTLRKEDSLEMDDIISLVGKYGGGREGKQHRAQRAAETAARRFRLSVAPSSR